MGEPIEYCGVRIGWHVSERGGTTTVLSKITVHSDQTTQEAFESIKRILLALTDLTGSTWTRQSQQKDLPVLRKKSFDDPELVYAFHVRTRHTEKYKLGDLRLQFIGDMLRDAARKKEQS